MPLELSSTTEEKVVGNTSAPTTTTGKPATVDGPLRVSVVSGDGTFAQDPASPLSFDVISGDAPGDTTYLVEADADLGAGVELIQDTVVYHVSGAKAANVGLTAGTVVPK